MHRARGYCCKSLCLHCPFGHTASKLGYEFQEVHELNLVEAQEILAARVPQGVAAMLLNQAFKPEKTFHINSENMSNYKMVTLKDFVIGLIYIKDKEEKLFLKTNFSDQGIELETVLSYYK